jgi:hypothetical protein
MQHGRLSHATAKLFIFSWIFDRKKTGESDAENTDVGPESSSDAWAGCRSPHFDRPSKGCYDQVLFRTSTSHPSPSSSLA